MFLRIRRILVALWLLLPLSTGFGEPTSASESDPNAPIRTVLQGVLEDFSVAGWDRRPREAPTVQSGSPFVPAAPEPIEEYRRHLLSFGGDWGPGPVWHQVGALPLQVGRRTERLGVNVFVPPVASHGTLLFVHGYMSHSANFAYTFAYFVSRGWTVVTLDLPGHGLSTGPRADIARFADYGDAVLGWLEWALAQEWPGPRVLLAHSLGTAASLEALRRPGAPRLDRVIFCAPLLRTDWYPALEAGETALGWWLKEFPSTFGWDGYLDGYRMPVHWFRELRQWLETLSAQPPLDLPLTIYSGDRDEVVDEGWNRSEYRRLVPGATYFVLPGKGHLFLTSKEDRQAFHERLGDLLGESVWP